MDQINDWMNQPKPFPLLPGTGGEQIIGVFLAIPALAFLPLASLGFIGAV